MNGELRELIPVGEQRIRLRMPEGAKPKQVRLLAADKKVRSQSSGPYLSLTVPSILDHEVVAVDL